MSQKHSAGSLKIPLRKKTAATGLGANHQTPNLFLPSSPHFLFSFLVHFLTCYTNNDDNKVKKKKKTHLPTASHSLPAYALCMLLITTEVGMQLCATFCLTRHSTYFSKLLQDFHNHFFLVKVVADHCKCPASTGRQKAKSGYLFPFSYCSENTSWLSPMGVLQLLG